MEKIKIIVGFIISFVLIYFSFKGVEWSSFKDALVNTSFLTILVVILINILVAIFKAWRWQILLSDIDNTSFQNCFNYLNIGYLANSIFPARAGEIIRPVMLAQKTRSSKIAVFTSIVVEHLFDFISILLLLFYTIFIIELPEWLKKGGLLVFTIAFSSLFIFILLAKKNKITENLVNVLPIGDKIKLFVSQKINNFLLAVTVLTKIKKTLNIFLLSTLVWVLYLLSTYLIIKSFNFRINELNASIITLVFIGFAMMIPSSPGYFGTYQIACIMSLALFDVAKTDALAASFLLQIPLYLLNIFLGIFSLWWEGLNFGKIANKGNKELLKSNSYFN